MTAPELKPCPFCGNANQDSILIEHLEGTVRHPAYRVMCDYCGASTGHTDHGDHVAKWNTRTPTLADALALPEVAALVEAAHPIAFWTIGNMLADDPKAAEEYPHLSRAILNLRAALAALTTAPVDGEKK